MPPKRHLGDMFYVTLNLSSHTLYEIGEDLMHTHDYLSIHNYVLCNLRRFPSFYGGRPSLEAPTKNFAGHIQLQYTTHFFL